MMFWFVWIGLVWFCLGGGGSDEFAALEIHWG
jgi:hypothetical protein